MPKAGLTAFALTLVVIIGLLPVGFSFYLAREHAMHELSERVQLLAMRTQWRTELVTQQAMDALESLSVIDAVPCSPLHLRAMREQTYALGYIRNAVYLDGDVPRCSVLDARLELPPLRKPDWQGRDVLVWQHLDKGSRRPMINARRGRYMVEVAADSYVDVVRRYDGVHFGIVDPVNRKVVAGDETSEPQKLMGALDNDHGTFWRDGNVFVVRQLPEWPLAVVAYAPLSNERQSLMRELLIWLPIGIACSGLMVWWLVRLLRELDSPKRRLQAALRKRQLFVEYQPIVALSGGECVGAEALLRWRQSDGSLVRPDLFIAQAEEDGMIQPLTDYLIERLFIELGAFLAINPGLHVSINLAAPDLTQRRVLDLLMPLLQRYAVRPEQICLEATERGFLDTRQTRLVMEDFRRAGHPIYIDDFGTGYSSLSCLQELPVDVLKIDKSFVDTLATSAATSKVAPHIIEMAHGLGLAMVAEGVETTVQAEYLREHGVQYGQGWLFARSLPAGEFIRYCRQYPLRPIADRA
ncbi:EAL domain-containing protein [Jeongeupia naejangsanensis]|uniref:cyclic-guanylate-specific phosphodiesterase n=1 Tax=Jeongeupia naejangsanensis TaxID=613195 RepID=A0ABS2BKW2_9NEIS|nr:EAL domain-containing protein [Jeongeupia naejangsanensis]MBM3116244.1 EAL domain-containing protein [Jeongeupia naejangsanensis]